MRVSPGFAVAGIVFIVVALFLRIITLPEPVKEIVPPASYPISKIGNDGYETTVHYLVGKEVKAETIENKRCRVVIEPEISQATIDFTDGYYYDNNGSKKIVYTTGLAHIKAAADLHLLSQDNSNW